MARFILAAAPVDIAPLRQRLMRPHAGAYASFEGWVRDHHAGRAVSGLHYEAYAALAVVEGERVLDEVMRRFEIADACCMHRTGTLGIGELAVWVGVSSAHRDAAFAACRHVIDTIKADVPIWKHERYADGEASWLHPRTEAEVVTPAARGAHGSPRKW